MRIVGTAGHVDHGKSSLVISLTGHNPDRWIEERERGMTLDLGFAPLRFHDGTEAGIIDVPGHERFIHNMLAGAAGIDILLLVVDALEGPRAQTVEHLQILGFLNVHKAIVALTKIDLVDAGTRDLAAQLVREACAGTVAEGAPVIGVSNVSGEGIEQLKRAIHDALVDLPPRRDDAPAFMPVDRVFALQGHGTVVTGTLMQGTIRSGDTLALQPSGQTARARSLQIFGRKVAAAGAGSRVAVNLPGLDVASIRRGDVVAAVNAFTPTSEIDVDFTPLPSVLPLLHRRTPVRVHIGAAEIEGKLVLDRRLSDARRVFARISLSRPTAYYRGSRIVLRRMSPKDLLGGAIVTERVSAAVDATDDDRSDEGGCFAAIDGRGMRPIAAAKVAAAANILEDAAAAFIAHLVQDGRIVALQKPLEYVSKRAFDDAFSVAEALLRERHAKAPWRLGCSAAEIAAAIGVDDSLATRLLAAWHEDGRIGRRARSWHLPDFTPSLSREQRAFFDKALAEQPNALLPVSYDELARAADAARIAGAREALESLVAVGALVRVGDDVYRRTQIERARALVVDVLSGNSAGATMSQLRDAFGTSRKYALPLLEHFDSTGFTIRDGDLRRLRVSAGNPKSPVQT